jgi:hypothetical protein
VSYTLHGLYIIERKSPKVLVHFSGNQGEIYVKPALSFFPALAEPDGEAGYTGA